MCAEKSDFFHCPAYKLMLSDIKLAVLKNPTPPQSHGTEDYQWDLKLMSIPTNKGGQVSLQDVNKNGLELTIKLVWVQGTVIQVNQNENLLTITDDGGTTNAHICDYLAVPGGDHPEIQIGSYIGALGTIWSNDPQIILKGSKVMYLGGKSIHKSMWEDEVRLSKAFLAGLIEPTFK